MAALWITIIVLVLTGLLACAGMIAARKPDAGAVIGKLVPFQGIIGIVALALGIWRLVEWIVGGGIDTLGSSPVFSILWLLASLLLIALGLLFGWSLIAKLSGQADGGATVARIASKQGALGIASLVVAAAWAILILGRINI